MMFPSDISKQEEVIKNNKRMDAKYFYVQGGVSKDNSFVKKLMLSQISKKENATGLSEDEKLLKNSLVEKGEKLPDYLNNILPILNYLKTL